MKEPPPPQLVALAREFPAAIAKRKIFMSLENMLRR